MRRLLALLTLCATLLFPSCAQFRDQGSELLDQAKVGLASAGKDIARELGDELRRTGDSVIVRAREELRDASGDIKTAALETLKDIPELAREGGERAAAEAIAKRLELEDAAKADEYRRRASEDGIGAANEWAFGGGLATIVGLLGLFWRTKGRLKDARDTVSVLTTATSSLPPDTLGQVKTAVAANGGKSARINEEIARSLLV